MRKPSGVSPGERSAVVIAPEAPYPAVGGGALRTASLLEYLRTRYRLDVVTFREPGRPDPRPAFPPGIAVQVIDLPANSRTPAARAARNVIRACRSVPPLIDRFGGFEVQLRTALEGRHFDVGVIEHFWCAPYAGLLRTICDRLVLDLHNVESVLASRQADAASGPVRLLARHFSGCYAGLEKRWIPVFDDVLVTSDIDAALVGRGTVYPNAIPYICLPEVQKQNEIVFSGNMEYEPNLAAVRWFAKHVWPPLRERRTGLIWRLIGRNEQTVRSLLGGDDRIHIAGAVEDAVPELARAQAAIVPVVSGSGTRVKIIEAWAAGVPVISTTIGAEGIPAIPDEHLRIADTPGDFLRVIEEVLDSSEMQSRLGVAGRRLYERRLTWTAAWELLKKTGL